MKLNRISPLLFGMFMLVFANAVVAGAADVISVSGAYARAVPPGQPNSASFMTLKNSTDQAIALVAAKSPAAKVVELHTHTMEGGMMRMRKVEEIDIPANGEAKLQPGGDHVMLIGLVEDLKPGAEISVTLVFGDGSEKEIKAPVEKVQMKMMKHDGTQSMH